MGNTSALTRYGIVVKKGSTATEALALLQGRFSGQAKAYGSTSAGAQEKFNNALRKLQVTVGQVLLPTVTAFSAKLVTILGKFQALPGPMQKVVVGLAAFGAAAAIMAPWVSSLIAVGKAMRLAALATKIWTAAQWLWNAAMSANPVALVVIAVVALVAVFVVLWKKCAWFRNFWTSLWGRVKSVAAGVAPVLAAVGRKILAALAWVWDKVAGAVKWFWGWAGPFIKAGITLWWAQIKLTVALNRRRRQEPPGRPSRPSSSGSGAGPGRSSRRRSPSGGRPSAPSSRSSSPGSGPPGTRSPPPCGPASTP